MTKAEQRAFAYQRELGMIDSVSDEHIVVRRMGFYDGYRAAVKDLKEWVEGQLTILDYSLPEEKQPEDLDEAAEKYADGEMMSGLAERAFIAGAKWQESQAPLPEDSVAFNNGVKEGKRLLMEEAVEGEVCESEYGLRDIVLQMEPFQKVMKGFKEGDKVKIIIVKQDAARRK